MTDRTVAQRGFISTGFSLLLVTLLILAMVLIAALIAGFRADSFVEGFVDTVKRLWILALIGGGGFLLLIAPTIADAFRALFKRDE
jgi:uncharacterized ion transporter superfamily protein YfcC